jgi:hypothetical protein
MMGWSCNAGLDANLCLEKFKVQSSRFKVNEGYVSRLMIKSLPLFMLYG